MYNQDVEFVVIIGVFWFICMMLIGITESIMQSARKRDTEFKKILNKIKRS